MTSSKGKEKQSDSQTLLEALASAIDGTDVDEAMRLAAEFNNSFGDLVRASVGPDSVIAHEDAGLLRGIGPATGDVEQKSNTRAGKRGEEEDDDPWSLSREDIPDKLKPGRPGGRADVTHAENLDETAPKRKTREDTQSSEDSVRPKSKKSKTKKKTHKKRKTQVPDSPPDSSSDSSSSSTGEETSDDSDDADKAELCYDITNFESADLPDLPDKWDKAFRKLRSYVPLSLFKPSLLENYHEDEKDSKSKDKSDLSKSSLKNLEKQITYGDFIEMSDLEERYAREIYGLDTYADYIVQHKKIVSDLKKTYNCWMIGLRYHLKVRTVIFRRRKLIKTKVRGKTSVKDKVKIPNGLQPSVERQARHDADRAGDLQFIDNPYALGGQKFGFNFSTGRQIVPSGTSHAKERQTEPNTTYSPGYRGNRAGAGKKPYARRQTYPFNRFHQNTADNYAGSPHS